MDPTSPGGPPGPQPSPAIVNQTMSEVFATVRNHPLASQMIEDGPNRLAMSWGQELAGMTPEHRSELIAARLRADHPAVAPLLLQGVPVTPPPTLGHQLLAEHNQMKGTPRWLGGK